MVERELGVDPHDFRRWVCLHEETHRTQFTSVTWLRPYVQQQMTEFLLASDLDPASILDRLRSAADAVAGAVRGGGESLIEAIQSPRQREILDRLTAVMTLVEGHGDYVMDAVGPTVVPSVAEIRAKFSARRVSAGRIEQAIRRILGIDLKMKQYEQGSKFVKTVVDQAGMDVFNKVWTSPETLPTREEITNPQAWLDRVGGCQRRAERQRRSRELKPSDRAWARTLRWPRSGWRCAGPWARPAWPPVTWSWSACSGGADSLALAAALAFEAPRAGLRGGGVTVDHGLQDGSAEQAQAVVKALTGLGLDPVQAISVTVPGPAGAAERWLPGPGGGRPRGQVPGAGPRGQLVRGRGGPARPHQGRSGRDRAARAGPRLGRPLAGRHGRAPGPLPAPAARDRPRPDPGRLRRPEPRGLGRPAERRPGVRPGPGPAPGAPGAGGRARARRGRGPGPYRSAAAG